MTYMWRSKVNLQESVLSFHHVGYKGRTQWSDLVVNALTLCVILSFLMFKNIQLGDNWIKLFVTNPDDLSSVSGPTS